MKLTCFFYYIVLMCFSYKTIFIGLLSIILGCSHTEKVAQSCQEVDWYEIGRQDGTKGLEVVSRTPVKVTCTDSDQSLAEAIYNNGFDAGVVQFCSPENGFELGKNKREIKNVCPTMLKSAFQERYNQGQRFAELTLQSQELNRKIKTLDVIINNHGLETATRDLLKSEKIEISLQLKNIQTELQTLNNFVN